MAEKEYQIGEMVVNPALGLCQIKSRERLEIDGEMQGFYVIMQGDVRVMVPDRQALKGGLRAIMTEEELQQVYALLSTPLPPETLNTDINPDPYPDLDATVHRREPLQTVEVARYLFNKLKESSLDKRQQEALEASLQQLAEEIAFLEKSTRGRIITKLKSILNTARKSRKR